MAGSRAGRIIPVVGRAGQLETGNPFDPASPQSPPRADHRLGTADHGTYTSKAYAQSVQSELDKA